MATTRWRPVSRRKKNHPVLRGVGRGAWYVSRHTSRGAWTATSWTAKHTWRGSSRVVQAAVLVPGGVAASDVKQWRDDRAQFGWDVTVVQCHCGCEQRLPHHQVAGHIEALPSVDRKPIPSGHAVLASQHPRRLRVVKAQTEVLTVNGAPVEQEQPPMRNPGRDEIACRCGTWVGRTVHYSRHAVTCSAVEELRNRRRRAAIPQNDTEPWGDPVPQPRVKASQIPNVDTLGQPPGKELAVQEPQNWAGSSSVLADPAFDNDNFEEEVPAFLQQVMAGFGQMIENFAGLADYFHGAGFDPNGQTVVHLRSATDGISAAQDSIEKAHDAANDFIANLHRPDFSKV